MPAYKDDKTGTWYYSYKSRDPVSGQWKHHKKRGFRTKAEARRAEQDAKDAGTARSGTTVREMITLWEDYSDATKGVRVKHKEHFENRFNKYLDMPMESLTKPVLSRFRAEIAKDDRYSTATKNLTITYVRSLIRFAHDIYDLPDNSAVLTRLKETDAEAMQEFEVWSPDEFDQFVQAVDNPLYALYFTFLYWTGCRRGEAIALQKADIGDHTATIKYSQRTQAEGLKPTKKRTVRTIKLDDQLWIQLQPLMDEPGPYLFGGKTGLSPTLIDKSFRAAVQASGVKRIRVHDLRHSHATWLINSGVNIVAVSRRLGHKDVSTTLDVYTHLLESTDNDMIGKINSYKNGENSPKNHPDMKKVQ